MDKSIIASRNYINADKKLPFAIRACGENFGVPVERVVMRDVLVTTADTFEASFGCGIVMKGTRMPDSERPSSVERVRFYGGGFYKESSGDSVEKASMVWLEPDGGMWMSLDPLPLPPTPICKE